MLVDPFTRSPVHPFIPSPVAEALPQAVEGVAQGGRSDDDEAVLFGQVVDFDDRLGHDTGCWIMDAGYESTDTRPRGRGSFQRLKSLKALDDWSDWNNGPLTDR